MDELWSRRRLIQAAGKTALVGAGAFGLHAMGGAGEALAVDWSKFFPDKMMGGFGVVNQLQGSASAAGRPLAVGGRVASGERVEVAAGGRLILNMSDRSVFQFTGPSSLELLLDMMRQGILRLFYGAILAVVPHDNHYLVEGPSATVGIKGTVFYREVFPHEGMRGKTMEGEMAVPQGVKDYFCTCFGEVAYLKPGNEREPFFSDRAHHHNAYFLDPRRKNMLIKAPMMNHFDPEIAALIRLQEGDKHESGWLKL